MSVPPDTPSMPSLWIDPNVLQLVGLGTAGDPYLPDGRHLRWFFGRYLGFPRSGFRLRRRRSPFDPNGRAEEVKQRMGSLATTKAVVGTSQWAQFGGIGLSQEGGFQYTKPSGSADPLLRITKKPLTIRLLPDNPSPAPHFGPALTNPASYVLLTIVRRDRTGYVTAEASYESAPDNLQFQDRRTAGQELGGCLPVPQQWVTETLLLQGGLIERVVISGTDAVLAAVQWLPTRLYVEMEGWTDVDTYFLPLTDAAQIYPEWSAKSGAQIAAERLHHARPHALPPWDHTAIPPAPDPAATVDADLQKRYLGAAFARVDDAMRTFLGGELATSKPQAAIEVPQTLTWDGNDAPGGGANVVYRPFDHLYSAATDPHMARLLGLMTTDKQEPAGVWDYCVSAAFTQLWMWWMLFPQELEQLAHTFAGKKNERAMAATTQREMFFAASVATGLARTAVPLPDPVETFTATPQPYPGGASVQTEVELAWPMPQVNFYEEPRRARVFFALRRNGGGSDVALHRIDDETDVRLPIVPTRDATVDGFMRLRDHTMPEYGKYQWRLSGMDLWGRFSPWKEAGAQVTDLVPPLAPTHVTAAFTSATSVAVSFHWSAFHQDAAKDVTAFELHLLQGKVEPSETTWGTLEHAPGALTAPLRFTWKALQVTSALPAGLSASVTSVALSADDGGGSRITVNLSPVTAPFDEARFARVSATVRALDATGNEGAFALRAVAERPDDTPPAAVTMPLEPQRTSYPDARGRAYYRVKFGVPAGMSAQVLRASQNALLEAAAMTSDAFEALDTTQRVTTLKQLATAHGQVFTADHQVPYASGAAEHVMTFARGERTWSVVAVQLRSQTGVLAPWPDDPGAFAVIAVRRAATPRVPVVTEARPGDRAATLHIAADPATTKYVVYRTRDAHKTSDVRGMRPVAELDALAAGIVFTDVDLYADALHYYRVVARGEDGAESEPSANIVVRPWSSVAPPAPQLLSVKTPAGKPALRELQFHIPRSDYPLTVFRRAADVASWELIGANSSGGAINLALQQVTPIAGGHAVTLVDTVPAAAAHYRYFVRIRDPRERFADSAAVEETA
ncbi:MAG TPA: hypothetical protein VF824_05270 [Thermoanaerobaculia bacterium]|jgi:hypothetical protein